MVHASNTTMSERKVAFTTSDGLRLEGVMSGANSDTCAILIHGFLSNMNSALFEHIHDSLSMSEFATLRFDLRGCGKSDDAPISLDQRIDVQTAIDFCIQEGYQRIVLIGHSLGGLYALQAQHEAIITRIGLASVTSSPSNNWGVFTPEEQNRMRSGKDIVKEVDSGSRKRYVISASYVSQRQAVDQGELMMKISEPVLLIHGGDDHVVEAENSIEAAPLLPANSDVRVIRRADHWFNEYFDEVCSLIIEWLSRQI
jgi:pimeloyl-ACP methyl ester carboxylesterase